MALVGVRDLPSRRNLFLRPRDPCRELGHVKLLRDRRPSIGRDHDHDAVLNDARPGHRAELDAYLFL